jgi:D-amino-acid oxidase
MATPAQNTVIVIGAGVSGLTTGIALAEAGWTVRVMAKDLPSRTTSAVAGASWGPYLDSDPKVLEWSDRTRVELQRIAAEAPASGVRLIDGIEAALYPFAIPAWARAVESFRPCDVAELPAGYVNGWRYTIPLVDMPIYLGYLELRLTAAGATIEQRTVDTFSDVTHLAPVIVNCTGLGARSLVPDDLLSPVRGQLVVAENPGIGTFFQDHAYGEDFTYLLPHDDHIILGGTLGGSTSEQPEPDMAEKIIERCTRIEPRLRDARILDHRVGFRPMRPQVRVERERIDSGYLLHNYGHGGLGLTLSWGCAFEVLELVRSMG